MKHLTSVTIVAGTEQRKEADMFYVPKLTLVSRVQALLHDGRLKIQAGLPEAKILKEELRDFTYKITDAGRWQFGARVGKHGDLVLAMAVALWRAADRNSGFLPWLRLARS